MAKKVFNGNETVNVYDNPWTEEVEYKGTNGGHNPTGLTKNSDVTMFIPSLYRFATGSTSGNQYDYHGLTTDRFEIPDS